MWIDNKLYKENLDDIIYDGNIDFYLFQNKDILVTGATGLIGSLIVDSLIYANIVFKLDCKIHALVRNQSKADEMFKDQLELDMGLIFVNCDVLDFHNYDSNIDYIIHGASETVSKMFITQPVNTIHTTLKGTENLLKVAKCKKIQSMVFLSTMEVYGNPCTDDIITEESFTNLDTASIRSCYPISKRMAENICFSYAEQFGFHVNVARLTQTFGTGVNYNDTRVFAEFARCKIENKDIILNTKGETKRNYVHTSDAVRAVFTILLKGENTIYNVANEETYCSIYEMAELVAKRCSGSTINVIINEKENISDFGYAPTLHMNLSSQKLQKLGWQATYDLKFMFEQLIQMIRNI